MTGSDDGYRVTTTQLSLEILETVLRLNGARLPDIVEELGVAKSTAHKHLTTLVENGYLIKTDDTYRIGLKLLNFGEHARTRWPGFHRIKEAVDELTERTNEECDFVAPDRGRIITIAESYHKWVKYGGEGAGESTKAYRAHIGSYYHMHATASGLAILATYSRDRVDEIVDRWGLPARTEHTITTREELSATLERVRERGYAVDDQGYTEGMRSVGKAVHDPNGEVVGALSVSGPTYRVDGTVLEHEIPEALAEVVANLERRFETANDVLW
jgi:DNA-binding IclR family transcriptional regulator